MKKAMITMIGALLGLSVAAVAPAAEMKHGDMKGMEMKGGMDMGQMGDMIHESAVGDHKLTYRVIDMKEKMKGMSMKDHDMSKMGSHHLMLYIAGPDGKPVGDGKVGYKITGPDGKEQKAMAMAMKGGFGADVDFKAKGSYTIKTKAVAGDAKLLDEFTYKMH